ncbi:MAG: glycosyltransferase family 39 protein [Anaerolineales bacterium]|nr:glycosyltransferase family 39 protein [Anaerolineales bacterium]
MKLSFPVRIYFVALILRLIPILLTSGLGIGLDDMFQYDMLARSISSGNGFRWYAQDDLKLLAPYVDFDLATANGYDPEHGLYTSFRAPLYPAFLAIVYFFSGEGFSRFLAARLVQVIFLGAPLAPLTYFVARYFFTAAHLKNVSLSDSEGSLIPKVRDSHLHDLLSKSRAAQVSVAENAPSERHSIFEISNTKDNERTAKVSAWVVACYPMLLVYPLGLGTENPFFILLLSSFYFLLKSIQEPSKQNFIFSGIFLALTALTRSVILPFAGLAILYLIFLPRLRKSVGNLSGLGESKQTSEVFPIKALLIGVAFAIVIAPWIIRNSLLHNKPTGIETSMGYNLYLGYHPDGNGSFVFGPSLDLLTIMDDAERDEVGTSQAVEFIKEQPERFIPLAINRLGYFFGLEKRVLMYFYANDIIGFIPKPLLLTIAAILLLPFVFVSISASLGLSLLKWKPQTILLFLLFAFYLLPHIFILSEDRFHLALIPYLAILAAHFWSVGFGAISRRWNESNMGKWMVTFAILGVFLLSLNWGFELSRDADKIAALLGPDGNKSYFPY